MLPKLRVVYTYVSITCDGHKDDSLISYGSYGNGFPHPSHIAKLKTHFYEKKCRQHTQASITKNSQANEEASHSSFQCQFVPVRTKSSPRLRAAQVVIDSNQLPSHKFIGNASKIGLTSSI